MKIAAIIAKWLAIGVVLCWLLCSVYPVRGAVIISLPATPEIVAAACQYIINCDEPLVEGGLSTWPFCQIVRATVFTTEEMAAKGTYLVVFKCKDSFMQEVVLYTVEALEGHFVRVLRFQAQQRIT